MRPLSGRWKRRTSRGRDGRNLYQPPLMVIKEHASLPMDFWTKCPLAFNHSILGIHAPKDQECDLKLFFETVKNRRKLYQFYCYLNGTRALVGKATANLRLDIGRVALSGRQAQA